METLFEKNMSIRQPDLFTDRERLKVVDWMTVYDQWSTIYQLKLENDYLVNMDMSMQRLMWGGVEVDVRIMDSDADYILGTDEDARYDIF